jgi:hypothetical protein
MIGPMRKTHPLFVLCLCALVLSAACAPTETPDFVREEYEQLFEGVSEDDWGRRIELLKAFDKKYGSFAIRDEARAAIAEHEAAVEGRFEFARELAREGRIDRADAVLRDLVEHFADSRAGREAAEYLRVEYPLFAAQMLLSQRRSADADARLEPLKSLKLDPTQSMRLNALLDNIALVGSAERAADAAKFRGACHVVRTLLLQHQAETGSFPLTLEITRLRAMLAESAPDHVDAFTEVTSYAGRADDFEMEVVDAAGRRASITPKAVEATTAP